MSEGGLRLGAQLLGADRCGFRLWAPRAREVEVHVTAPRERRERLAPEGKGYFYGELEGVRAGSRYLYRLDGGVERPDPASRFQPTGVHEASEVVDGRFEWTDQGWFGCPLRDYVLYELHVGTFTRAGTFEAILPELARLKALGITAVELMPVAQFPGGRNWGYDGVYPFAAQAAYGGPRELMRLVNACHEGGLAVVLDVVYNHLGPEGNYLENFGPYFTEAYQTPWGKALNFDGPRSDEVRRFFIENALYWQRVFHIDALRLDAVHAIRDFSSVPFLEQLQRETARQGERLNRRFYLIAESDQNDSRLILPPEVGGYGLAGQWSDDFHHALHVLLTGEQSGYYADFGGLEPLARVLRNGYAYAGDYSRYRRRRHGRSARGTGFKQFVVCSQNHDQVGNRMLGDRLSQGRSLEELKLAAGAVLLSPFIPLLFMGEEYGETAPFQYFTSHGDPALVEAVRRGRREEFAAFGWQGECPDPQSEATFERSKLDPSLREQERHRVLWEYYQGLMRLRSGSAALLSAERETTEILVLAGAELLLCRYRGEGEELVVGLAFGQEKKPAVLPLPAGDWEKAWDSAELRWRGSGSALPERYRSGGTLHAAFSPRSVFAYRRFEGPPAKEEAAERE